MFEGKKVQEAEKGRGGKGSNFIASGEGKKKEETIASPSLEREKGGKERFFEPGLHLSKKKEKPQRQHEGEGSQFPKKESRGRKRKSQTKGGERGMVVCRTGGKNFLGRDRISHHQQRRGRYDMQGKGKKRIPFRQTRKKEPCGVGGMT